MANFDIFTSGESDSNPTPAEVIANIPANYFTFFESNLFVTGLSIALANIANLRRDDEGDTHKELHSQLIKLKKLALKETLATIILGEWENKDKDDMPRNIGHTLGNMANQIFGIVRESDSELADKLVDEFLAL